MKPLRTSFGTIPAGTQLHPEGWLKRQLQLQALGQAGNLDKFWPDVHDSAWIGGAAEGWERVPYWLDGFIDLAYMLDDDDLKTRAKHYIDAIIARQCPDGWICPCPEDKRGEYDMWSLFLLSKVLRVWFVRTGDTRVKPVLLKAFKQLQSHLAAYPLKNWGKYRWYEGLLALNWLYEETGENWLLELAETIRQQSYDYPGLVANWPYQGKETKWTFEAHVVNLAMALHSELLYQKLHPENNDDGSQFAEQLCGNLQRWHSMAHGHFTGDECLAGDSPSQGSEFCSVVEAMFSEELLLSETGKAIWGDRLERLAYNALPATTTSDLWAHQYDQQTNQIGCVDEPTPIWSTNGRQSNWFGLEPNYGCCTANQGQGWPKFAANAFLLAEKTIISALILPCELNTEINGVKVQCKVITDYPFRDTAEYVVTVAQPVDFTLKIRIPGFASAAELDGAALQPGQYHEIKRTWNGTTQLHLQLHFKTEFVQRPRNLVALWRGPLLFSLPIPSRIVIHEYESKGVIRKFPYCDYELFPTAPWSYGFAGQDFTVTEHPVFAQPFSESNPPLTITATMQPVPWKIHAGSKCAAAPTPEPGVLGAPETKTLIPYGCTMLRMTEMPLLLFDK